MMLGSGCHEGSRLKRNTFHQQIEDGLRRELDPEVFERCASALLRADYPALVPIRGGGDSGMDGAIADGEGPAFPLVCTTGKNVIGNLARSLASYLDHGGSRRKVVVATSQFLTPTRRQNLLGRAKEKGFELIQIHDGADFANRLHENPAWCLELLNLNGEAPSLSVEPVTSRPLTDQELTGREDDLVWLSAATGDRLLVGEPGSGKTSLLRKLVLEGWGLFLVTADIARVAPEVRAKKPRFIAVDDAHVAPEVVLRLAQLRREISAGFSIVASVWPGARDEMVTRLCLGPSDVRELAPLDRDQIAEVVRSAGIAGPTGLIREIVDQAHGRPGLAVTLAKLCFNQGAGEVALGTALTRDLAVFLRKLDHDAPLEILASFAFGGNAGMPLDGVARAYAYSLIELRQIVASLALAGIVSDAGGGAISMWPERLRHALVRDVFFSGPGQLDFTPLLDAAVKLDYVVDTLIGAKAVGGDVPAGLLLKLLDEVDSEFLWARYAWLGPQEAAEVLSRATCLSSELAQAALDWIPEAAIQRLLDHGQAFDRGTEWHEGEAMRWLRYWVASARPGSFEAIERRRLLLVGVTSWMAKTGWTEIGYLAAALAFSPTANWTETDPGIGRTVTISSGLLGVLELEQLERLWDGWIEENLPDSAMRWHPLSELLRGWVYVNDGPVAGQVPPDIAQARRRIAGRMLADLAPRFADRPGIQQRLLEFATVIGLDLIVCIDGEYETLFPPSDGQADWSECEAACIEDVRRLAVRWATDTPEKVVRKLARLLREAESASKGWPRYSNLACERIAELIDDPLNWVRAVRDAGLSGVHLRPFLSRLVRMDDTAWAEVEALLGDPEYAAECLGLALSEPTVPHRVLEMAVGRLDESNAALVFTLIIRKQLPPPTLLLLLGHADRRVAFAAAKGMWLAEPKGVVDVTILEVWGLAIVDDTPGSGDSYWIGPAFSSHPGLRRRWLESQLLRYPAAWKRSRDVIALAANHLETEERLALLEQLAGQAVSSDLIAILIGDDEQAFRRLLRDPRWAREHLVPLGGSRVGGRTGEGSWLTPGWIRKAREAVLSGYAVDRVVAALLDSPKSWWGEESEMWAECVRGFDALASDPDLILRSIGRFGVGLAIARRDEARTRERNDAVYGR